VTEAGERTFVDRDADLVAGKAELAANSTGLSVLAVTGEPGIGKTRYLAEIRRYAKRIGWLVAAGQASKLEREIPFSACADALTPLVLAKPTLVSELPAPLAAAVTAILPVVREAPSEPEAVLGREAHLAARALLERLSSDCPLLIVLDDMHWADDGTIELIDHLLRHGTTNRVLLAVGYRPRQVPGRLAAILGLTASLSAVRHVRLGPLSAAQTAEFLGRPITHSIAFQLHKAADGNPRYLEALARAGPAAQASEVRLPADVGAALRAEVDGLPAAERTVLEAASVLGAAFDSELLPVVANMPDNRVWAAMDTLVAVDLLRADEDFGRLRFRHPLIWRVVYQAIGLGWRRSAHTRAVQALTKRSAPTNHLAHHVAQAATTGDEVAIRMLVRAAAAQQRRAPAAAARWYEAALRLVPTDQRWPARRARLLVAKAECSLAAGRPRESEQAISEALPMLWQGARPVLRRAVRVAAKVRNIQGQFDEAAALLRRAVRQPGLANAELLLHLATAELLRGDFNAAWMLAERVRTDPDDVSAKFGASSVLAFVAASAGDAAAATSAADVAAELLDGSCDAEMTRQSLSAVWLMWTDVMLTHYPRALRIQDRALTACQAGGEGHMRAQWLIGKAETLRRMGRLADARQTAEEATELARLSGSAELTLFADLTLCRIVISSGVVADVARFAAEVKNGAASCSGLFRALGLAVAAEASLLADKADECIAGVLAAGGTSLATFDPSTRVMLFEMLTRAALAAGRLSDAQQWTSRASEVEDTGVLPCAVGYASLAAAQLLLTTDHPDEAVVACARAVKEFDWVDNPLDGVRARLVMAGAQAARGQRSEAIATLHEADEVAYRCGAEGLRKATRGELERLGRRVSGPRPSGRSGEKLAALSRRERQVAELVADGGTNRAIAAELFLSEKTIERHLSSAFVKLGVSSRTALATRLLNESRTG
jgi:DNA-binding CsgD family transcriptional regulator/tetratricopeptide (TPR) repeat protein